MLLECKIRRQGGTTVDLPNEDGSTTAYHFKPLDPTRADSPHVADVADMAHLSRFISAAPETYVPFEGKAPKVDLPKPAAIAKGGDAPVAGTPAQVEAAADKAADNDADTNNDGVLSVAELSAGIAAGKFTPEALRELLAQEEETGAPRKGFVKVITQALK